MPLKLLLVDDDRELCEELRDMLGDAGYLVETAEDGAQGARMIAAADYDAAILDFKMPGSDGIELLEAIKRKSPRARVLLVTGRPDMEELLKDEPLASLADGLLGKPFEPEELLKKLSALEGK
ncbi:MAG: response regulator [Elusimicrobiota bacterium]